MRPIGLGLLAALIVAMMAPAAAMAAPAKAAPSAVRAEDRKAGMADAPALIAAAGAPCKVTDARLVGKAAADKKTGSLGSSLYEVACENQPGFLVQTTATTPNAFSCLLVNYPADPATKSPNTCVLPGNLDLKPALAPLFASAKITCAPDAIRGIGQTATNTLIEVACPGGSVGYIITASTPLDVNKPATAANCLGYDAAEGNIKCILAPAATRLTVIDNYAKLANNGCAVKDRRFVGLFTDGTEGYEVACDNGKGYIYKVTAGAVKETLDCAKVPGDTCKLTDSRAATAEQAGLYTKLAKNSGSSCTVARYAIFPTRGAEEVVELVCADGAGAIGMFPATGKGKVLDCGHALVAGYKCTLGKPDYAALTADLRKFDKKECTVSSVGSPLKAADGTIRLEVACSDGLPGYMIAFSDPQTAKEAVACSFAGNCTLPTNKPKAKS
ncbi:hypothetical protein [Phenylobacterium sp.]|uniref:hypothetical protein n=1 Tax=Phenylobacterium sp. TaxID=1871053 RepID=UPI0035647AB5